MQQQAIGFSGRAFYSSRFVVPEKVGQNIMVSRSITSMGYERPFSLCAKITAPTTLSRVVGGGPVGSGNAMAQQQTYCPRPTTITTQQQPQNHKHQQLSNTRPSFHEQLTTNDLGGTSLKSVTHQYQLIWITTFHLTTINHLGNIPLITTTNTDKHHHPQSLPNHTVTSRLGRKVVKFLVSRRDKSESRDDTQDSRI